jgi:hypothetical protein
MIVELRQAVRDLLAENIRLRQMIVDLKEQIALYEYDTDDHK